MRRYRIVGDKFPIQEVNGMRVVRVYATVEDFTKFINAKIPEEQKEVYEDCQWFPVNMSVSEDDMTVNFTLASVKK